jgi:hypothetical protein
MSRGSVVVRAGQRDNQDYRKAEKPAGHLSREEVKFVHWKGKRCAALFRFVNLFSSDPG